MKLERTYFDDIDKLIKSSKREEAEKVLMDFSIQVEANPSYPGCYWLAESYYCMDNKKYASKIIENINNASIYIKKMNKELPPKAETLKAKSYHHLGDNDKALEILTDVINRMEFDEAYYVRGIIKAKMGHEDPWMDIKKASTLGHIEATVLLKKLNSKK